MVKAYSAIIASFDQSDQ